jgi:hypothetical protein
MTSTTHDSKTSSHTRKTYRYITSDLTDGLNKNMRTLDGAIVDRGAIHIATTTINVSKVTNHSWYDLCVHIPRSNGGIERAILRELLFTPYGVYIRARFRRGDGFKVKDVHPVTIVCLHMLWLKVDIVSDDEHEDVSLVMYETMNECTQDLPHLTIDSSVVKQLDEDQVTCFEHLSHQVRQVLSISNTFHVVGST